MTLPASGVISFGDINTELGLSATATLGLGDAAPRHLAGVASGAISTSDFYSKTFYARASTSAEIASDGSYSNPTNAYDQDTAITEDTSTYATVSKPPSGTYPGTETVRFSGFGSGTRTGYVRIYFYASVTDTGADPGTTSSAYIEVNGNNIYQLDSLGTGGTWTQGPTSVSTGSASYNLATLYVDFTCMGGRQSLGDQASAVFNVFDIRFILS